LKLATLKSTSPEELAARCEEYDVAHPGRDGRSGEVLT